MDVTQLAIHDVRMVETYTFDRAGVSVPLTRVTFYVGDQGPLTLEYKKADFTIDKAKADMSAKRQMLLELLAHTM